MKVDMPELRELRRLEAAVENARTVKKFINAKARLDMFWIRLRKEVEEAYGDS